VASLPVCIEKNVNFWVLVFVGDIVSGIGLGIFGQGHEALNPTCRMQCFDSRFYWKIGYNPSLLSP